MEVPGQHVSLLWPEFLVPEHLGEAAQYLNLGLRYAAVGHGDQLDAAHQHCA